MLLSLIHIFQGDPWYQVYLDYAIQNGMLTGKEFPGGYSKAITRGQMAHVFASALPDSELTAINLVNTLPDVNASTPYSKDIFLLSVSYTHLEGKPCEPRFVMTGRRMPPLWESC